MLKHLSREYTRQNACYVSAADAENTILPKHEADQHCSRCYERKVKS